MLTQSELTSMRVTQSAAMMDRCEVLNQVQGAADAYGKPAITWDVVAVTPCGLSHSQTNSEAMGKAEVPIEIRTLRLPADCVPANISRIRMTHRFGVQLTPAELYEVVGDPQHGPSGLMLQIRRVTDG